MQPDASSQKLLVSYTMANLTEHLRAAMVWAQFQIMRPRLRFKRPGIEQVKIIVYLSVYFITALP